MRRQIVYSLVVSLSCVSSLWASSPFTDLDFESATLVPIPGDPYRVYFSLALPGWTGFSGINQLNVAYYDNADVFYTAIGIIDSNTLAEVFQFIKGGVIQGNYTAFLEAGVGYDLNPADASLSQIGLVPIGTKSLSFLAFTNGPFAVSLGGTNLSLTSSPVAGQRYSLFQADVSAFAGQMEELDFTVFADLRVRSLVLDDIQFSPDTIPEPSTFALTASALMLLFSIRAWRSAD